MEVITRIVEFEGVAYDCGFARDITERKESEQKLEYAVGQLNALNQAAAELAQFREEEALVQRVPHILTAGLDFDRAGIWLSGAYGSLVPKAVHWAKDPPGTLERFKEIMKRENIPKPRFFEECLEQNRTIKIDSPFDPAYHPALKEVVGIERAMLITPLRCQGKPIGVMFASMAYTDRDLDDRDVTRFETFAGMVGLSLDNIRFQRSLNDQVEARTRELQMAQAALVHSEKMASLGQLVAGISHEMNTPVGAIRSSQDTLRKALLKMQAAMPEVPERRLRLAVETALEACRVLEAGSARVTGLLERLRRFARLDEAEYKLSDLHEGIDDALMLLRQQMGTGISVAKRYGELPPIYCSPGGLNQVFVNLIMNAAQAIEGEGKITIRTATEGRMVKVEIVDTGRGIAPDERPRIFDPGYTTRGKGVGSGLGLSICETIVREHGGRIDVESTQGSGSTFRIELPVALPSSRPTA